MSSDVRSSCWDIPGQPSPDLLAVLKTVGMRLSVEPETHAA